MIGIESNASTTKRAMTEAAEIQENATNGKQGGNGNKHNLSRIDVLFSNDFRGILGCLADSNSMFVVAEIISF